jgi:MFS transporter, DHA2 family, multidrug resistance protein
VPGPEGDQRAGGVTRLPAVGRRWAILGVLCMSLVIVSLSNASLNVALPTLSNSLRASPSELQWIVAAYSMMFAGLLLTGGSLGDRFGPRHALNAGLVTFGAASGFGAMSHTVISVIAARGVMGVGAALVMPATLSILSRVFPVEERAQAIAIWAGVAGVGGAAGVVLTGWLLQHFWWGSVFLANVAAVTVALIGGALMIPPTRPVAQATRIDVPASLLSTLGIAGLVYAAISAPRAGWFTGRTLIVVAGSLVIISAFIRWELAVRQPMFDVRHFRDKRFSVAAVTITVIFFVMYGTVFLLSQYLQLVNGLSPMEAGERLLPLPLTFLVAAPLSERAVRKCGNRWVVCSGLALLAVGAGSLSQLAVRPDEALVGLTLATMAAGMGMTTAPSTTVIMNSLSARDAGSGSAVNDATRELGGALGVAVLGSLVTTLFAQAEPALVRGHTASLASALVHASYLPHPVATRIERQSRLAYVHALGLTFALTAAALAVACVMVTLLLSAERTAQQPATDGQHVTDAGLGEVRSVLAPSTGSEPARSPRTP